MKLKLIDADKKFLTHRNERVLFRHADFKLESGMMTALTGASGNGKSTIINILSGFESLDSGSYIFDEEDITNDFSKIAKLRYGNMAIIPQGMLLIGQLTGLQNINIAFDAKHDILSYLCSWLVNGRKNTISDINEQRRLFDNYVMELSDSLHASDLLSKKAQILSLGERQRIAIIRALSFSPKIILADEPTSALNNELKRIVLQQFRNQVARGASVLIVSHDTDILNQCDMVYLLEDGVLSIV